MTVHYKITDKIEFSQWLLIANNRLVHQLVGDGKLLHRSDLLPQRVKFHIVVKI